MDSNSGTWFSTDTMASATELIGSVFDFYGSKNNMKASQAQAEAEAEKTKQAQIFAGVQGGSGSGLSGLLQGNTLIIIIVIAAAMFFMRK